MSDLERISLGTGVDLSGLRRGLDVAATQVDAFLAQSDRLKALPVAFATPKPPELPAIAGPGPAAMAGAGDLAGAILPLAAKIESAIVKAMAPLNGFAARISAQFDVVGKVLVNAAVKADRAIRFPRAVEGVNFLKASVVARFTEIEGKVGKTFRAIDRALDFGRKGLEVKNFVDQLRSIRLGQVNELAKLKAPTLNFDHSTRSITTINNAARAATDSFKGLASQVALALGAFGLAYKAVDFLKGGVKGAADLNETLSKTQAIFGGASGVIVAEADRMAKAFGTAKNEYITAAGNFGAVFKGVGKSQADAAALGNTLAKLGMDLASFDNTSNEAAFTAISSALRGEFDPIEKFRVFLSADRVAAEAMALGLARAGKAVDEAGKKQATLSLILRQTADAQGDLERTAGGTANSQRRLSGTLANIGATIGAALLPLVDKALAALNGLAARLGAAFDAARPAVDRAVAAIGAGFDRVSAAAATLWPPLKALGLALAAAFDGGALAPFLPRFDSVVGGIRAGLESAGRAVRATIDWFRRVPGMVDEAFGAGTASKIGSIAAAIAAVSVSLSALGGGIAAASALAAAIVAPLVTVPVLAATAGIGLAALTGSYVSLADTSDAFTFALRNSTDMFSWWYHSAKDFIAHIVEEFEALRVTIKNLVSDPLGGWKFEAPEFKESAETQAARERMARTEFGPKAAPPAIPGGMLDGLKSAQSQLEATLKSLPGAAPPPAAGKPPAPAFDVEAAKELDKFAERLRDGLKTPAEKFTEGMAKAKEAFAKGLITAEQLAKAPHEVAKQAGKTEFGKDFLDKLRTPQERFADSLAKLDDAMRAGLINPHQYGKAKAEVARDAGLVDVERLKTPQQKLAESLAKLDAALRAGAIDPLQYKRAKVQAVDEAGLKDDGKLAGADRADSTEGYSAIVRNLSGRGDGLDRLERVNLQQLAEQRRTNDLQAENNRIQARNAGPAALETL